MLKVEHVAHTGAEQVWAVLADGWMYASWVVGAVRMRDVDQGWPAVGTRLHHSIGVWPVLVHDTTHVLEQVPGRRLVLQARGWPVGEARIVLELHDLTGLEGPRCRIVMSEDATSGPGRLLPRPVRQLAVVPRNRESLRRLATLAEHKIDPADGTQR